jgi:hypothetical protein
MRTIRVALLILACSTTAAAQTAFTVEQVPAILSRPISSPRRAAHESPGR